MSKYDQIGFQAATQLMKRPKAEVEAAIRRFRAAKKELGDAVEKAYHRLRHKKLNTIPNR